ncbi:glycoside hydrolase family 20 zincin-like fold domain-containing protein, partial [Vibrio parahaemolyticus]
FVRGLEGDNLKRTPDDNNIFATAATRFAKNQDVTLQDVSSALIPTPTHITAQTGVVSIAQGIAWNSQVLDSAQNAALAERASLLGVNLNGSLATDVRIEPTAFSGDMAKSGAYTLQVTANGITIRAFDEAGAFYAMQSVLGLVDIANA